MSRSRDSGLDRTRPSWSLFLVGPAALFSLLLIALPLVGLAGISLFEWNLSQAGAPAVRRTGNYVTDPPGRRVLETRLPRRRCSWPRAWSLQVVAVSQSHLLFSIVCPAWGVIRTLFLAPMMIAPVFAGMIWRLCLSDDFGIVETPACRALVGCSRPCG